MNKGAGVTLNGWTSELEQPATTHGKVPPDKNGLGKLGEIVVGQRIEEFFSEVSVVGLKYVVIAGAAYVRKAIWLIFVLGGLGFMIFQFHDRISYFASNPTNVDVKITRESELVFPTVTVCNENLISRSLADLLPGLTELITEIYPPWPSEDFKPNFDTVDFLEAALNITDWGVIWLYGAPFINENAWQHCTFNGARCNMSEIRLVPTTQGYCLQFNGENVNYTVNSPGAEMGLWMLVNISQLDYMYARTRMAGVRVTIHEKHEVPSISKYGIAANPGHVTFIGLNKKIIKDLPTPYTNCSEEEGYSTQECYAKCFEKYVIGNCGCGLYYFVDEDKVTCDPREAYECADVYATNFSINSSLISQCNCPPQCENTKYIYTISSAAASKFAMETIARNEDVIYTDEELQDAVIRIREDMLEVMVYYQDMQVERVTMQKGYTTLALLCDIGGALGLVLGATILTVFEIVDFVLVLVYDLIRYRIAKRHTRKMEGKVNPLGMPQTES